MCSLIHRQKSFTIFVLEILHKYQVTNWWLKNLLMWSNKEADFFSLKSTKVSLSLEWASRVLHQLWPICWTFQLKSYELCSCCLGISFSWTISLKSGRKHTSAGTTETWKKNPSVSENHWPIWLLDNTQKKCEWLLLNRFGPAVDDPTFTEQAGCRRQVNIKYLTSLSTLKRLRGRGSNRSSYTVTGSWGLLSTSI